MKNLLSADHLVAAPIEEGDAGIILKRDGSFRVFSTGNIDPKNLTPSQLDQGAKLQALALALSIPQVMSVLLQMTADPNIVGEPGIDIGEKH